MTAKTFFSHHDFSEILSAYDLGTYIDSVPVAQGTVQTNFFLQTSQRKVVFRYYENRAKESVLFERDLLVHLTAQRYPCPAPFKNRQGAYVGQVHQKPYMLFEFMAGQHIEHPNAKQKQQITQQVAKLQQLTQGFHSPYTSHRWNYGPELCLTLAQAETDKLNTKAAHKKLAWLDDTLATLHFPPGLAKGICHCDFHYSNILFQEGKFIALLDFDDANYTYPQFDLVGLIEYWAWPHRADRLDLATAREVVQAYLQYRSMSSIEQQSLFDVYQLSILFDCIWFFSRGLGDDFYEKRKIDSLTSLGREKFYEALFH